FNMTRLEYRRVKFVLGIIYETPIDVIRNIPAMLREIVEADGQKFVRAGFTTFNASSLDFDMEFDVMKPEFEAMFDARNRIGMAILERFNAEGISFAYPTQTSFTAAPDGTMIMTYPDAYVPVVTKSDP